VSTLLPELRTTEITAAQLRLKTRLFGPQFKLVYKKEAKMEKQIYPKGYPRSISPHPSHVPMLGLVPDYHWEPFGCHDDMFKVVVRDDAELARLLMPR
jgi:hypothetical protein